MKIIVNSFPPVRALRLFAGLVCTILLVPVALAQQKPVATPKEAVNRAAIEAVIRDYLLKNPGLVREALQALEVQEKQAKSLRAREALTRLREPLERDPRSPVGGNPDGDVTVVEFFDYRCSYCRRVADTVSQLTALDPNVRIVYKEFPILGAESLVASRSALAAHKQGKYVEFHKALMAADQADEANIEKIVAELGLDASRFKADRDDAATGAVIDASYSLASELEIGGTPAFIIGDRLVPGAAGLAALQEMVAAHRKGK